MSETETKSSPRGRRKEQLGEVLSNRMTKTIVVRVKRRFPHPQFRKIITRFRHFYAHDEKQEAQIGDFVRIELTRPLSRTKRWRLVQVVRRAADAVESSAG